MEFKNIGARPLGATATAALFALTLLAPRMASADESTIKHPGAHSNYVFEAEPHALAAPFDDFRPGVGFRGTIEVVDNGFVTSINNTVGIGFGADWIKDRLRVPVVMQWNFWLTRHWSVFGEPGGVLRFDYQGKDQRLRPELAFYAGGRYAFSDSVALTLRVGFPVASFGVSFFL